jgi:polyribonucleotide nucleotidyltransferase
LFFFFFFNIPLSILRIEAGGEQISEDIMKDALKLAHESVQKIVASQKEFVSSKLEYSGNEKKPVTPLNDDLYIDLLQKYYHEANQLYSSTLETELSQKDVRSDLEGAFRAKLIQEVDQDERWKEISSLVKGMTVDKVIHEAFRDSILKNGVSDSAITRSDGRKQNEVRPLEAVVDPLPNTHGSAYFKRGDTHVVCTTTLASAEDCREYYSTNGDGQVKKEYFFLNYDFPPYCTGEVSALLATNRRMVGHGALAEKALRYVIPPFEEFPYTVRVFSECVSSNGSSSMASACAGTISLKAAGVPLLADVAGLSIGLVTDKSFAELHCNDEELLQQGNNYRILTDILGSEDHHGDMDFKVAGTKNGITAVQLDVKLTGGVPIPILNEALDQAKIGRNHILSTMKQAPALVSKNSVPKKLPKAALVKVDPDRLGHVIGPSGGVVDTIKKFYDISVNIMEDTDDTIYIYGEDCRYVDEAKELIEDIGVLVKPNKAFEKAQIIDVRDYGFLMKFGRSQYGLLHFSEITDDKDIVSKPLNSIFKRGQVMPVKVLSVDKITGLVKLSRKLYYEEGHLNAEGKDERLKEVIESTPQPIETDGPQIQTKPPRPWDRTFFVSQVVTEKTDRPPESFVEPIKSFPRETERQQRDRDNYRRRDERKSYEPVKEDKKFDNFRQTLTDLRKTRAEKAVTRTSTPHKQPEKSSFQIRDMMETVSKTNKVSSSAKPTVEVKNVQPDKIRKVDDQSTAPPSGLFASLRANSMKRVPDKTSQTDSQQQQLKETTNVQTQKDSARGTSSMKNVQATELLSEKPIIQETKKFESKQTKKPAPISGGLFSGLSEISDDSKVVKKSNGQENLYNAKEKSVEEQPVKVNSRKSASKVPESFIQQKQVREAPKNSSWIEWSDTEEPTSIPTKAAQKEPAATKSTSAPRGLFASLMASASKDSQTKAIPKDEKEGPTQRKQSPTPTKTIPTEPVVPKSTPAPRGLFAGLMAGSSKDSKTIPKDEAESFTKQKQVPESAKDSSWIEWSDTEEPTPIPTKAAQEEPVVPKSTSAPRGLFAGLMAGTSKDTKAKAIPKDDAESFTKQKQVREAPKNSSWIEWSDPEEPTPTPTKAVVAKSTSAPRGLFAGLMDGASKDSKAKAIPKDETESFTQQKQVRKAPKNSSWIEWSDTEEPTPIPTKAAQKEPAAIKATSAPRGLFAGLIAGASKDTKSATPSTKEKPVEPIIKTDKTAKRPKNKDMPVEPIIAADYEPQPGLLSKYEAVKPKQVQVAVAEEKESFTLVEREESLPQTISYGESPLLMAKYFEVQTAKEPTKPVKSKQSKKKESTGFVSGLLSEYDKTPAVKKSEKESKPEEPAEVTVEEVKVSRKRKAKLDSLENSVAIKNLLSEITRPDETDNVSAIEKESVDKDQILDASKAKKALDSKTSEWMNKFII